MNAAVQTRSHSAKPGGILAGLKFSTAVQPKKSQPDQRTPRQVVGEWLAQQIGLVDADIAGKPFTVSKTRFKKDAAGKSVKTTVEVAPRRSYWKHEKDEKGRYSIAIRYGHTVVQPAPNMTSVEAGLSLEAVRSTFEALRKALDAGELDNQIQQAALAAKKNFAPKEQQ